MSPFPPPALPLRLGMAIAARLMPFAIAGRSLEQMLAQARPAAGARAYRRHSAPAIMAAVRRSTRRPWLMRDRRCLRQGLLAFHYLSLAGHAPVLRFGLRPQTPSGARPDAHCWVEAGGECLNPPSFPMIELFSFDGEATAIPPLAGRLVVHG